MSAAPLQRGLAFEQAPPLGAPLRFFLTAPLFGVLAAALLAWQGPALLASRLTPGTLGLTHLLTLGVLGMLMVGALMQMLPVVAAAPLPWPRAVAVFVHAALGAGALGLGCGLALGAAPAVAVAVPLLAAGLGGFALLAAVALARSRARPAAALDMALPLAALLAVVALGAHLGLARARGAAAAMQWTDLHAAWALVGWVGLLVANVARQVVPMFQMTPPYPRWLAASLGPAMFTALCIKIAAVAAGGALPETLADLTLALGLASFAAATLRLQAQRRRPVADATLFFWRLGMASLLAACALWLGLRAAPVTAPHPGLELLLGVLYLHGFAVSVANGMLYKIVPFLGWFHLQALSGGMHTIPNMKQFVSERAARLQLALHAASLLALACACMWPAPLARPAALLLAANFALLWVNLVRAALLYRRVRARLEGAPPAARPDGRGL